jgi:hypothetical protein
MTDTDYRIETLAIMYDYEDHRILQVEVRVMDFLTLSTRPFIQAGATR